MAKRKEPPKPTTDEMLAAAGFAVRKKEGITVMTRAGSDKGDDFRKNVRSSEQARLNNLRSNPRVFVPRPEEPIR